jgi:hypothetical protein
MTTLAGPVNFDVVPLREGALDGKSYAQIDAYRESLEALSLSISMTSILLREGNERVRALRTALSRTDVDSPELASQLFSLNNSLMDLDIRINGDKAKAEIGEIQKPTINSRMGVARRGLSTTYGPTQMHAESLEIAKAEYIEVEALVNTLTTIEIPKLERALQDIGAPWIVGQTLPKS